MSNQTYPIEISKYEKCKMSRHRWRFPGHSISTLVMRRRVSENSDPLTGNVVYWSWHVCECGWNTFGRVTMVNEEMEQELDLTGGGK